MADLKTTNIYGDAYINNKVGIATNAPATRLQIGQLLPTAATEGIQFGDDTSARIYRDSSTVIKVSGGFTSTTFINAGNYLQTSGNLIYPASQTATQRLEVGNASGNAWIDGLTIAQGGNVTVYNNLTTPTATVSGYITFPNDTTAAGLINTAGTAWLRLDDGGGNMHMGNSQSGAGIYCDSNAFYWRTANAATTLMSLSGNGDLGAARYLSGTYVNTSDDTSSATVSYIMAKFGDNYHRSAPAAKVATFLSGQTMNIVGTSTNITAYTINQNVGTANTPSFAGVISSAVTGYAYLQVVDTNNFWITPGNVNWGLYFETSAGGLLGGTGDSNRLGFVGSGAARFYVDLNNGNGWFGGTLTSVGNISGANLSGTNTGDQSIGNGTITIAAGTGVGVGSSNTFTTNQSGATTVTISNSGVTSNVAGTGISVSGATGAVTITNSGVTSAVAGTGIGVSGATGAVTITNSGVTSLAGTTNRITVSGATGAVTLNLPQDIHTGASPTFAGLSLTSVSTTGATITNLTGAYQNTTVYDSPRTQSATPSRGIRAPASSIQFTDSYAIAPFYTYRSTGDWPVPYGIGWGTGGESSGIFQRYASNGYSFGDMIFYTGNDGYGAFSFRRHTWEGTTYFAAGSGELNTELFRVDWSGNLTMLGTLNGSANSATLYPNNGAYGSWKIGGTRGGWYGIEFESGTILMANSSESGFYRNGVGWQMWWSGGTGYVQKGGSGGGTQATILESSNYTSYTPGLGTNNTLTAINTINNSNNTVINNQSGNLGLTMYQATAGTDAYMTFHIGSDFAAYFGLGGAENDLVYGGWSVGNVRHRILHSGNAPYAWNMNQYVRTTDTCSFAALTVSNTITGAVSGNAGTVTNGLYTTGGQTIAGITYFSNGESINAYGIRGRFTNEYLHLYNKVGVGHPGGWGQGETSTPTQGLSTYGGLNIAYGDNGISTFNGVIRANSNIRQGADLAMPLSSWSVGGTSTGMVIFSFPGNTGNYGMVHCVFDIYEYNSNAVSTVIVGGHNWNGAWYNTGANVIGRCGKSVRLGVKDSKFCVVFGGAASSWEYGTIVLRKIHNGGFYTGVMDMGGSFTTQQTATESFSNISGDLRLLRTSADFIADGGISGTTGTFSSNLSIAGDHQIRNANPTIIFRDTNERTAYIHVNSNVFYVLSAVADSGYGSWAQVANSRWPLEINLSNNNAVFGADVNAISFTGAGTGLTGTAASLNIGGNATTATTLQTARNINGTSFNGSAAITTANWGTARTLTIGSTGKSVDGSAAITWSLAEIGAAATNQTMFIGTTSVAINRASAGQTLTGISIDGSAASCTGNAATATGQQSGVHFTLNTGGAGYGLVGQYNPDTHQGLFAMGAAYTLGAGGTLANFYGVSWSYDYTGRQLNTGYLLQHCMAVANAGVVATVIGLGIWTNGLIRANGAISSGGTITAAAFSGPLTGNVTGNVTGNTSGTAGSISGFNNPTTAATANTIVYRDSGGHITGAYILGSYFNASAGNSENPTIGQIWTQNTTDNYLRKSTPAHFRSQVTDGSYPSLTGANASGTWSINITGNAGTATSATSATSATTATNGFSVKPGWAGAQNLIADLANFNNSVPSGFYQYSGATNSPSATWYNLINVRHSNTGNDHGFQLAMSYYDNNLWFRSYQGGTGANNGTFQSWAKTLSDQNYTDYTVTKTGTGASGTWAINITGNAATATTATNVTIANGSVTLAKIENITAYTILGNSNASAVATPAALSVATVATMLSGQTMNINGSSTSCSGNAASATLATKASTLSQNGGNGTGMTFNWSGQGGQPTWLWGSNDGSNIYVWNPSNFNVNYATSAGSATSAGTATSAGSATTAGSCSGNAATATNVAASGITGQTGMWTSAARPGPYRLYRNDDDSAYNVQLTWQAHRTSYWSLRGFLNDGFHAECFVVYSGYADSAGSAGALTTGNTYQVASLGIGVAASNKLHINGDGSNPTIRIDNTAFGSGTSSSRGFFGWLPISISGVTRYIQLYS